MDATQGRYTPCFIEMRMAAVTQDRLGAPPEMSRDGDQVAHRPADDQKGRFLAAPLGGHPLEPVHRGVFAEHVVSKLGIREGLPHLLGGKGYPIATQINRLHIALLTTNRHTPRFTAHSGLTIA